MELQIVLLSLALMFCSALLAFVAIGMRNNFERGVLAAYFCLKWTEEERQARLPDDEGIARAKKILSVLDDNTQHFDEFFEGVTEHPKYW